MYWVKLNKKSYIKQEWNLLVNAGQLIYLDLFHFENITSVTLSLADPGDATSKRHSELICIQILSEKAGKQDCRVYLLLYRLWVMVSAPPLEILYNLLAIQGLDYVPYVYDLHQ